MFVYRAKNPHEEVIIPYDYRVLSISFKNHNVMVERLSETTLEELEKLFPETENKKISEL